MSETATSSILLVDDGSARTIRDAAQRRVAMLERIKLLAGQFLQRCSLDVVALRTLLTPVDNGDADVLDARVFKELAHLAHRMCGTGASLGFESLSTCAAAIERLAEGQEGTAVANQKVVRRLVECVAALEFEVDRMIHPSA